MTANITIHGDRKDDVLAIPQRAIITASDGSKSVEVVSGGKIVNTPVSTGLRGSDGNIEITGGLTEGELFIPSPTSQ